MQMNLSLKHPHCTTSVQTAISVNRGGVHYGIHYSMSSLIVCHSLMLWIMGWSFLWEMQFLIPAVAQERVWSLVSPSPVFLVPKDSSGMLLAEPLDEERPGHCLLWHSTRAFNTWSCREDTEWVFPSMLFASERHVALQLCLDVLSCCQTVRCCQEHLVCFACIQCQRVIMCPAADQLWEEDADSDVSPQTLLSHQH